MTGLGADFPIYFDGSMHVAQEAQAGNGERLAQPVADEEWRRYIGANPFGIENQE